MKNTYYDKSANEVLSMLNTSNKGLNNTYVDKLIDKYGYNEIPSKKDETIFSMLLKELKEPIEIVLIIAIIISFLSGEIVDAIAIIFIVVVDIILGIYQECKANKNAKALQNMMKVNAKVIRNNKEMIIDSKYLVVGDIVKLASGDKISADMRVIESDDVLIDESLITGESINVKKNEKIVKKVKDITIPNILYAGTSVVSGRALAVVIKTGINTELGKLANVVNNTEETLSPLSIRMQKFTKQISLFIVIMSLILMVILKIKGNSFSDIFLVVVALAVSAMPEGLPLAKTMALTIASNRMMKKNVLVKNLNSVEALGSCTVIASDKTGTLTKNEQTASVIVLNDGSMHNVSGVGYQKNGKIENINDDIRKIALHGFINNEAYIDNDTYIGDSIDVAFIYLGYKAGIKDLKGYKVLKNIPYESINNYSAVFYEYNNEVYCTVKGSIEKLMEFTNNKNKDIENYSNNLAKMGYRVIALCSKKLEKKKEYSTKDLKNLEFDGLVGFIDPIRNDCKKAIKECSRAGIKVLMITGDHQLTATKIAKDLKLISSDDEVTTGVELSKFKNKDSNEFYEFIKTKKVFARISPMDKYYIVSALKNMGEFVAVTGDGVNDAPALKCANIGISMGSGTDVSKDSSNMILLDDKFSSIVDGVKEGRCAYNNIRKICYLLLSCGFAEVLFFVIALLCDLPMPLVAIQLLWLNVVTDGIQDIALSFEKTTDDIMLEKPRDPKESIFNKQMIGEILISSIYIGSIVFALFVILVKVINVDIKVARGYVMCLMVFIQNVHVLNCRSESKSIFKYKNKNFFVPFAIISCILLQIIVMEVDVFSLFLQTVSIPINDLFYLLLLALSIILVMESYKFITKKYK